MLLMPSDFSRSLISCSLLVSSNSLFANSNSLSRNDESFALICSISSISFFDIAMMSAVSETEEFVVVVSRRIGPLPE